MPVIACHIAEHCQRVSSQRANMLVFCRLSKIHEPKCASHQCMVEQLSCALVLGSAVKRQ